VEFWRFASRRPSTRLMAACTRRPVRSTPPSSALSRPSRLTITKNDRQAQHDGKIKIETICRLISNGLMIAEIPKNQENVGNVVPPRSHCQAWLAL